jgi:hypothetical protein
MSANLPPNIQEFNEITAVIFSQLYISHPFPKTLEPTDIAAVLGTSLHEKMPSGRTFNDVFSHTLAWLVHQGFVSALGSHMRERDLLTDKALSAMNVVPPSLSQTRGAELVDATRQATSTDGKSRIAKLVGNMIGGIIETMTS